MLDLKVLQSTDDYRLSQLLTRSVDKSGEATLLRLYLFLAAYFVASALDTRIKTRVIEHVEKKHHLRTLEALKGVRSADRSCCG